MATHPAVAVAAAVAMPDPLFGERVCVFVELKTLPPSTYRPSSNTFCSRAFRRSCCPNDSKFSTNCRARLAARSQKAYFATRSGRH